MEPRILGEKYDKIAQWWHDRHYDSQYGIPAFQKALRFLEPNGEALDVGCGAGGRFIRLLEAKHIEVTGIDVSKEMIALARLNHPKQHFQVEDITIWETERKFDFIFAWDSIFHLPFEQHEPVLKKLCHMLNKGGILFYTFGDDVGHHTDTWHEDTFYYSSIGINGNCQLLIEQGMKLMHLELDQYPLNHVYLVARKESD